MLNKKISIRRSAYLFFVLILMCALTAFLCIYSNVLIDEIVCLVIIDVIFYILLIFGLMKKRIYESRPNQVTTYSRHLLVFIIAVAATVAITLYVPEFFAPFMAIAILFSCVMDGTAGTVLSVYFVIIYSLSCGKSNYIICCYVILVITGCLLTEIYKSCKALERTLLSIGCLAVNVLLPFVFYYFSYSELNSVIFLYAIISAAVTTVVFAASPVIFSKSEVKTDTHFYEDAITEGYPLLEDIRRYSSIEYAHDVKVSNLCGICARAINIDVPLIRCAGFYYRIGKTLGEPEIDNAIKVLNEHCFPDNITKIISEYQGILAKPTSKESAIIHMVDAVVTRIEVLGSDSMSSSWNQSMVIYKTLNDLSEQGIYDNSGLSMNEFLQIREILANEDILS